MEGRGENLTFCSKCLFGTFPKKTAWKKITTNRPVFKYRGCEKRWRTPGPQAVTPQLEKTKQDPEEEGQVC